MNSMMKFAAAIIAVVTVNPKPTKADENSTPIKLSYRNGKSDETNIEKVNKILASIGTHLSQVVIADEALPIIATSRERALTERESQKIMSLFTLRRGQLLKAISDARRKPEVYQGGSLTTSDFGDSPYPKVFDMKAIPAEVLPAAQAKYSKLHVNLSDNGIAIDELMTVVSGGPWVWFFRLLDGEIVRLTVGPFKDSKTAVRLSYSGRVPHAAFLGAPDGLTIAYAIGPKNFRMSYEDDRVQGSKDLGTNPWIDFNNSSPKLMIHD